MKITHALDPASIYRAAGLVLVIGVILLAVARVLFSPPESRT